MLRAGMVERFKKAMPVLKEMVKDLEWLQDEFDPKTATEEERAYAKHLMMLGCNSFDEADWRLTRMFKAVGKTGYLVRNSAGRFEIDGTDIEFTCGSCCEVYAPYFSDEDGLMTWIPTTIEYDKDYYFTARSKMPVEGALVRVKG